MAARRLAQAVNQGAASLNHGLGTHGLGAALPLAAASSSTRSPAWVFLGPPGVGKGTYSSRVADCLGVPHIAAGDLVRTEIKRQTPYGIKAQSIVEKGNLLPDSMILELIRMRIREGRQRGELGHLLDGFPRTQLQAQAMDEFVDTRLVINLQLREEVSLCRRIGCKMLIDRHLHEILTAKCLGRRMCQQCGKNFNVADIMLPASDTQPEIRMPPLNPPAACMDKMATRSDDTLDVINNRLEVYKSEATPVEEHFRSKGRLMTFEITGGIPETLPRLLDALRPYSALTEERKAFNSKQRQLQALQQTAATSQSGASVENLQAASAGAV